MIRNFKKLFASLIALALFPYFSPISTYAVTTSIERASVDSAGNQGNGGSEEIWVSANGRYAAFKSSASNLVPGDTNAQADVFVRDLVTDTTERVNVDSNGNQANGWSSPSAISSNGRYVVFESLASDLVSNDTNNNSDVFLHDSDTGITERISINSGGDQGNGYSSDGRGISADGRYVVFSSSASNLVPGDTNAQADVFVRDLVTDTTERVNVDSNGNQANNGAGHPSISDDGRYVVFGSSSTNLVLGDTNNFYDIFLHDRSMGITELISINSNGNQANSSSTSVWTSISGDGRYVVFDSSATNLAPNLRIDNQRSTFIRDRLNQTTELVGINSDGIEANTETYSTDISADGRYVTFSSFANNLAPNDTNNVSDIFLHDRSNGNTVRISVNNNGVEGNLSSFESRISDDGLIVAFTSYANNLVPNDTNAIGDVFVSSTTPSNQSPIANAGLDQIVSEGDIVTLDGSGSTDPDGASDIVGYNWNFGDGGTGSGVTSTHTYLDNGIYTATLTITDTVGHLSTDTATVTVLNVNPFVTSGSDSIINEGSAYSDSGSFLDPGTDTWTATVDYGDGSGTHPLALSGKTFNLNRQYLDNGSYTVTIRVVDDDGGVGTDTTLVTVNNISPTATFSISPGTILQGGSSTLSFSNQYDPSNTDALAGFTYSYDCTNDGIFELVDGLSTSFVCFYPNSGIYTSTGRIKDKDDGYTDYSATIIVQTPSEAINDLVDQVETFNLQQGIENSLDAKLDSALNALSDVNQNNNQAAINSLQAFINAVNAQRGSKITNEQADALVAVAQAIINSL